MKTTYRFFVLRNLVLLSALVLSAGLYSCQTTPPAQASAPLAKAASAKIRLACVGDSITIGYQVAPRESWPSILQGLLGDTWEVGNFGVSSKTLLAKGDQPYRMTRAWTDSHDFQPDIVIIMLGTNDTKAPNWLNTDEETMKNDLKEMVKTYQDLPSRPKVMIARPAFIVGDGQWGITEENLLEILPVIDQAAGEMGLPLIDIQALTKDHPEYYQDDNIHPNPEGYKIIAAFIYQTLTGKSPRS